MSIFSTVTSKVIAFTAVATITASSVAVAWNGQSGLNDMYAKAQQWQSDIQALVTNNGKMVTAFNTYKTDAIKQINSKISEVNDLESRLSGSSTTIAATQKQLDAANTNLNQANSDVAATDSQFATIDSSIKTSESSVTDASTMPTTVNMSDPSLTTDTYSTTTSSTTTTTSSTSAMTGTGTATDPYTVSYKSGQAPLTINSRYTISTNSDGSYQLKNNMTGGTTSYNYVPGGSVSTMPTNGSESIPAASTKVTIEYITGSVHEYYTINLQ